VEALTGYFITDTTESWMERLEDVGIPAGPVLDIAQMTSDPQALARNMVQEAAPTKVLGHPVKYSATPTSIQRTAPVLGEHTEEVLAEAGYSEAEIAAMIAAGAAGRGE